MKVLNGFIRSVEWWKLIPSGLNGMKNLVVAGNVADTSESYVAAACTKNGNLLVAYIPPKHVGSITIDLSVLSGNSDASWFDPTNGKYKMIAGLLTSKKGKQEFNTPGLNAAGDKDWVLVIRKAVGK